MKIIRDDADELIIHHSPPIFFRIMLGIFVAAVFVALSMELPNADVLAILVTLLIECLLVFLFLRTFGLRQFHFDAGEKTLTWNIATFFSKSAGTCPLAGIKRVWIEEVEDVVRIILDTCSGPLSLTECHYSASLISANSTTETIRRWLAEHGFRTES